MFAIVSPQHAVAGFAQPQHLFQHCVEYRREVARRGIDDLQHLGGRGLLIEGFLKLPFALLALGHIADCADQPHRPAALVTHRHRMVLYPAEFVAAEADAVFATEARRLALQGGAKGGPVGLEILRMDTGIPLLARSLAGAGAGILPAEQLDQAMRHPQPVVGDVPVVDAFRHGLNDKGVPFLRGPQARLGDPQRLGDRALLFERLVALAAQFGDELRRIGRFARRAS